MYLLCFIVMLFIFREGLVSKRSGGHSQVTNCLGCHACCACRFSVWRIRWDSSLEVLKNIHIVVFIRPRYYLT